MVPDGAPVPVSATLSDSTLLITVTFDGPLTPGALSPFNWIGECNPLGPFVILNAATPPIAAGSAVTWTAFAAGGGTPPCRVSYNATPPDLLGLSGAPVAAFANFPMTRVP